ncbi:MAG TPA: hypothetical protein PLP27_00900 [Crocinitomicaceae bacterium]|nr:hypothetical protein [Crocinitomicaceae bacterium]
METITLKIDLRSKAGKAFKTMLDAVYLKQPGIEIVKEKSAYNPKFVKKIRNAEKQIKEGKYKVLDTNDIWGSLGLS